jgi:hypothetical protein
VLSIGDILQGIQLLIQLATGRRKETMVQVPGQPKQRMDIRVAATAFIWLCATGILGIWMLGTFLILLLTSDSGEALKIAEIVESSIVIPILTLVFAGVTTTMVWKNAKDVVPQPVETVSQKQLIEERLANLETIVTRKESQAEPLPRE